MDHRKVSETGSQSPPSSMSSNNNNSSSSTTSGTSPPPPSQASSNNSNTSSSTSTPTPPASPPPSPPQSPPPAPPQSPPPPATSTPPPPPASSSPPPPPAAQQKSPPRPESSKSPPPPPHSAAQTPPSSPAIPETPSNSSTPALSPPHAANKTSPASANKTPPPSKSSPNSNKSPTHSNSDNSLSAENIYFLVGVAVAGFILLALCITCVACVRTRKKKKKKQRYYYDPSHRPPHDQFYMLPMQHHDPAVKLPPPGGANGWGGLPPQPPGGAGGWGTTPTPPPPAFMSNEFGGGFSGQHNSHLTPPSPRMGGIGGLGQSQFSYEELAAATDGFSQGNLLGQGGFGFVHKGVLPDKREVAVKSLKSGSGQGEREFQAEVEIISRVHHRHLVSLVGYCITENQRMLVYEFVPNGTLEFHLHGKGRPPMDWPVRLQIAVGAAKGLAYLHEDCHPRIIHRDIKTANILIDNNFEAMVADFGLAKLTTDNFTHVSTRVMGTFGYLAPEYAQSGKLTEKSDVFSFGVMLLELITGRKPVDTASMEDSLVDWARPLLTKAMEDGNYDELADPRLEGDFNPHEMAQMVASASASIRHSARRRPRMSQIVRSLQGDSSLDELNEGVRKAAQSGGFGSAGNVGYDTGAYNADMQKFRKMVMPTTQDFASGDYGTTSEYGLNLSASSSDVNSSPPKHKH